jgi:GT2 family glycosyltransferase
MSSAAPTVSVVMPNHNGGAWLGEAVASVLDQTLADIELIVVDDGSTDGSPERLRAFADRDPRVRAVCLPKVGVVAARNRALDEARGEFIACLDADDLALPTRLERQVRYLRANVDVGIVATRSQGIGRDGGHRGRPATSGLAAESVRLALERGNPIVHSSVMARAELVRRLGGYRQAFDVAEDFDMWLRACEVADIEVLPDVLIKNRVSAGSLTRRSALRMAFLVRLARRSARARRAGAPDPVDGLIGSPEWTVPPAAGALQFEDAALFRWLDPNAACCEADGWVQAARETLIDQLPRLSFSERRLAAQAIVARLFGRDARAAREARSLLLRLVRKHPRTVMIAAASLRAKG